MCKQTFPGHESDINAVTVRIHYINNIVGDYGLILDKILAYSEKLIII